MMECYCRHCVTWSLKPSIQTPERDKRAVLHSPVAPALPADLRLSKFVTTNTEADVPKTVGCREEALSIAQSVSTSIPNDPLATTPIAKRAQFLASPFRLGSCLSESSTVGQPVEWELSMLSNDSPSVLVDQNSLLTPCWLVSSRSIYVVGTKLRLHIPSQPNLFTILHPQRDPDTRETYDFLSSSPRLFLRLAVLLHDSDSPPATEKPQHSPRELDLGELFPRAHARPTGPREKGPGRGCDKRSRLPVVRAIVHGRGVLVAPFRSGRDTRSARRHPAIGSEGEAVCAPGVGVVMETCDVDLDNCVGRYGDFFAMNLEIYKLRGCPPWDHRDRAVEPQGFVLMHKLLLVSVETCREATARFASHPSTRAPLCHLGTCSPTYHDCLASR